MSLDEVPCKQTEGPGVPDDGVAGAVSSENLKSRIFWSCTQDMNVRPMQTPW